MLEIRSDAPTNAGEHVKLRISSNTLRIQSFDQLVQMMCVMALLNFQPFVMT